MFDSFTFIDAVLILLAVLAGWGGWRQGLIGGVMSFVGFVGGGVVGILIAPRILDVLGLTGAAGLAVAMVVVLVVAGIGNGLLVAGSRFVTKRIIWRPVRIVDSVGGAAFSVAALALVAWLLASAVVVLPDVGMARSVRSSALLGALDSAVPQGARDWVSDLGTFLDDSGLPRVFTGLGSEPVVPVAEPDSALLSDPAVRRASNSLVKVEGIAPGCSTQVDGSGFVYAPGRVMTNAHVVAGTEQLEIRVRGVGRAYPARVVVLDTLTDVAVLDVPGLRAPALSFTKDAARGDSAVIAGFPGGGRLTVVPARIRAELAARGKDIYDRGSVTRQVYSIRGLVRPGNSGGPLLASDGSVYGVVFAAALDDPDTGYALTAGQVSAAAAQGLGAIDAVPTGSCETR